MSEGQFLFLIACGHEILYNCMFSAYACRTAHNILVHVCLYMHICVYTQLRVCTAVSTYILISINAVCLVGRERGRPGKYHTHGSYGPRKAGEPTVQFNRVLHLPGTSFQSLMDEQTEGHVQVSTASAGGEDRAHLGHLPLG